YVLLSIGVTEAEQGDVTRIIGQVVTGVGFLGAGVILREQMRVKGLTTAATIWCSSAVGCLAGAGWYEATAVAVGGILLVNRGLRPLEALVQRLRAPKTRTPTEEEEEEL
ncbi:MAG: MgtC/SapB family protein, partial [Bacteroidetes bacterium]